MKYNLIHSEKQVAISRVKKLIQKFLPRYEDWELVEEINREEVDVILLKNPENQTFISLEQALSFSKKTTSDIAKKTLIEIFHAMDRTADKNWDSVCFEDKKLFNTLGGIQIKGKASWVTAKGEEISFKNESSMPWVKMFHIITGPCGAGKKFVQVQLADLFDSAIDGKDIKKGTVIVHNKNVSSPKITQVIWKKHRIKGWNVISTSDKFEAGSPLGFAIQEELLRGTNIFIFRDSELIHWENPPIKFLDSISNRLPSAPATLVVSEMETSFNYLENTSWETKPAAVFGQSMRHIPALPAWFFKACSLNGAIQYQAASFSLQKEYLKIKGKHLTSQYENTEHFQEVPMEIEQNTQPNSLLLYKSRKKEKILLAMTVEEIENKKKQRETKKNKKIKDLETKKEDNSEAGKEQKKPNLFEFIEESLPKEYEEMEKREKIAVAESPLTLDVPDPQGEIRVPEVLDDHRGISLDVNAEEQEALLPEININRITTYEVLYSVIQQMKKSNLWKQYQGIVYFYHNSEWKEVLSYSGSELLFSEWLVDSFNWKSGKWDVICPIYLAPLILNKSKESLIELSKSEIDKTQKIEFIQEKMLLVEENLREVIPIGEQEFLTDGIYYLDIETSGQGKEGPLNPLKNKIELVSISDGKTPVLYSARKATETQLIQFFERLFKNTIVGHNILFDLTTIYAKTGLLPEKVFDTMLGEALLLAGEKERPSRSLLSGVGLKLTLERRLGIEVDKTEQVSDWAAVWTASQLEYSYKDVLYLPELCRIQIEELNKIQHSMSPNSVGLQNYVARVEMAMVPLCAEMTVKGIPVNYSFIESSLKEAHEEEINFKEAFINKYPQVQNVNSIPQVLAALQQDKCSLDNLQEDTLKTFLHHEGAKLLLDYKKAAQINRNLQKYKFEILHPSWIIIGSAPGRMTCNSPNVQNIPRKLKKDFYSPELTLVRADYPAIELRIAAVFAKEQSLIDAFNSGSDPHKLTASKITGKLESEINKEERQLAKAMNYGLLYGMGNHRFQQSAYTEYGLIMTVEEASAFRQKFFEAYPAFKAWHKNTEKALRENHGAIVHTLMGRRIFHPEEDYTNALNSPIQGTGADMLKFAAGGIYHALKSLTVPEGLERPRILTLIHDEIVVLSPKELKNTVAVIVRDWMEKSAKLLIPSVSTPVEVEFQDGVKNQNLLLS